MNMIEVKTAELSGSALDWAVAKAVPQKHWPVILGGKVYLDTDYDHIPYSPSTDWSQGGPLIQKHGCDLNCIAPANCWEANCWDDLVPTPGLHLQEAETPLIAACRAIVAAKLGDVVQVPAELIGEQK